MSKKEELFVLIKSLSQSEKRYFKLVCKRERSGKNYLLLFNAINAQEIYDESAIKEKFANKAFVKQLHVTKNYLRQLILKSLRNFHGKLSKEIEAKGILQNIEILFNKELYALCKTEIEKCIRVSEKYELNHVLAETYDWKRKIDQHENPQGYDIFKASLNSQKEAIKKINNNNDYLNLIVDISRTGQTESTKRVKNEALLASPKNALSEEALVMHYNANFFKHLQQGNSEKAEKTLFDLLEHLEKTPHRIIENPGLYAGSINNAISYFVFNKSYKKAQTLIQRAKETYQNFKLKSENRSVLKQILRTYNIELEVYRDTKQYLLNPEIVHSLEEFVFQNRHKMPKEYLISFWFQLAYIRFMQQDFKNSLKLVNYILQGQFKSVRTDIQLHTRFLSLMIHLEEQNFFVLRYFADSTKRYLKKIKQVAPYEKILLSFFIRIGKTPSLEFKKEYQDLYNNLFPEEEKELLLESNFDYIDYKEWISKKI